MEFVTSCPKHGKKLDLKAKSRSTSTCALLFKGPQSKQISNPMRSLRINNPLPLAAGFGLR